MTAFFRLHPRRETSRMTDTFTEMEEKYTLRRAIAEREGSAIGKTDSGLDFCSSKTLQQRRFTLSIPRKHERTSYRILSLINFSLQKKTSMSQSRISHTTPSSIPQNHTFYKPGDETYLNVAPSTNPPLLRYKTSEAVLTPNSASLVLRRGGLENSRSTLHITKLEHDQLRTTMGLQMRESISE